MAMARVRSSTAANKRQRLLTNPLMNPLMAMGMNPGMHPMFGTMLNPAMAALNQPLDLDESDSENAVVPSANASGSAPASHAVPDGRPASGGDAAEVDPAAAAAANALRDLAVHRAALYDHRGREDQRINRSTSTIRSLPRIRLGELLEAIDHDLDAATTSDLSTQACVQLVWLTTRQKPSVSVSALRVGWYTELNTICRNKYVKMLSQPNNGLAAVMEQVKAEPALDDDFIAAVVRTQGWSDLWMARAKAKGVPPARPAGQRIIVDYQAPPKAGSVTPVPQMLAPVAKAHQVANEVPASKASPVIPAKASPPAVPTLVVAPPVPAASGSSGVALVHDLPSGPSVAPPVPKLGGVPRLAVPSEFGDTEQDDAEMDGEPVAHGDNETTENSGTGVGAVTSAEDANAAEDSMENAATSGAAAEEASENASGAAECPDVIRCIICHEKIEKDGPEEVIALECSHVYHVSCVEKSWTIGGWPRGWCPRRCLDHILGLTDSGASPAPMMMMPGPEQLVEQPVGGDAFAL